jgi:hypothetical protein
MSPYYLESVAAGRSFQQQNKSWSGQDVVKYQRLIKDLVDHYGARTILDYGCGKGLQYKEKMPYDSGSGKDRHNQDQWQTFDQYLGVSVYCYDPCVEEFETPPPPDAKFDGVICTQVLNNIPDDDMAWVRATLEQHAEKFCFIGLNFQRVAKGKKTIYNPEYFRAPRDREFFRSHYENWSGSDLFWWFKDRVYYEQWLHDQLDGTWKDIPDLLTSKYQQVVKVNQVK